MQINNRDSYFDNLKGFLIIAVIVGNSLEVANPKYVNIHFLILLLYVFHMPLFAFVSGYFSKLSTRTVKEKVKDTIKLYFYSQMFYTAFNFFILGRDDVSLKLLMPQWTLWYLLSLVCWHMIEDYIKEHKKWIIFTITLAILVGFDASIGTNGSVSRTLFFLPFFIAGNAFKLEYISILKLNRIKILMVSIITLGALWVLSQETPVELFFEYSKYTWYFDSPWFPMYMRMFHYFAAVFVGMTILIYIPKKKTALDKLGRYSLILYLVHSGVAQILIGYKLLKYDSLLDVIISTIIIVIVVVIISFSWVMIKKRIKASHFNPFLKSVGAMIT
ncbi:acyltransferase family protein [Clostridium gasigenes]|uniref:acyltransferase family protein n=1 Tax=Clostridium gasigenes TaxID=94869 RepID=UPI0016259D80|nr:acyltransferase family protein [Clostridium gasigenes]MBB6624763.1 acyltransferase family protein [Clostridium gasigenes]MBU3090363.1 acyltransferase family protein [Clostridium gasigenes]